MMGKMVCDIQNEASGENIILVNYLKQIAKAVYIHWRSTDKRSYR